MIALRILVPILQAFGILERDNISHPFKPQEEPQTEPQRDLQEAPEEMQNIIKTSWGTSRSNVAVHVELDTERNVFEFDRSKSFKRALAMSADFGWADVAVLKDSKVSETSYKKVRPFVVSGESNKEIAERFGWKVATAEKYCAKVRKAIRLFQENDGQNPSPLGK